MKDRCYLDDWDLVQNDICPTCGGELDTGWECNKCGADWIEMALDEDPSAIVEFEECI